MSNDTVVSLAAPARVCDPLTELLRSGARRLIEVALHHVGVGLGLTDGGTGTVIPRCDDISAAGNAAYVQIMREIVEQSVLPPRERNF